MLAGARHIRRSQLQLRLYHLLTLFLTFLSSCCQSTKAIQIAPTKIMFRSQSTAFRVRVVSYNVLSSHLASPSHFTTLDPTHLEASNRLPVIFEKLEEEIKDGKNAIVCLQEVSHDWAGAFHTWFANRGYHFITGLYGKRFNGYMGVGVAYPTQVYETLDVDISRLSDKRIGGWPVEPEASTTAKVLSSISPLWKVPLQAVGLSSPPQPDHWTISENRFNILVTATLRDKTTGRAFCIGNYHMPCCFYAPRVMSIHTEMAARHVQDMASEKDLPYILAGDWNITPDSPTYKLMTTGELDADDETYPTSKHDMDWKCTIQPMRSAYAVANSAEPDFTNYARIGERDPFIDTLDYIFLSKEWKVESVKEICHRNEADGPFPNAKEPSDHVLIAAELLLDSITINKMSAAAETAKIEMEAAREEVTQGEKEINEVKTALRRIASAPGGQDEAPNTLEIAVLKVEGLPEGAMPSFSLQLSSPVEEQVLDKLFDPLAPTENVAVFSGVEAANATLTVAAKDADIELGVSTLYEVAPLCPIDAMSPKPQYVTELAVAIVAESKDDEKEEMFQDSKEDLTESPSAEVVQPVCTVTLRVTYKPSIKDQREELYDLLNKASQKKAKAIAQLRQSAMAASRSAQHTEAATAESKKSPAVKSGFLNKKKKEPSKIRAWYDKNLGPQSLLRQVILPVSKNYIIFFGTIALCHWKGHELALPAPV